MCVQIYSVYKQRYTAIYWGGLVSIRRFWGLMHGAFQLGWAGLGLGLGLGLGVSGLRGRVCVCQLLGLPTV